MKEFFVFDELEEYEINDHFFFTNEKSLNDVCNAPKNSIGVFIVYALKRGNIELKYIGSAGRIKKDGKIKSTESGLYSEIVNEAKSSRKFSLTQKLKKGKLEALDIYWYETFNQNIQDIPSFVEALLLQKYFTLYGELPDWNKEY